MDKIYKAIIELIKSILPNEFVSFKSNEGNDIYPFYKANDNNIILPKNNKYVVIRHDIDHAMSLFMVPRYDKINKKNIYTSINSTNFYVDIYGDHADDNSRQIHACIKNGFANEFFLLNNYMELSIHNIKDIKNLSDVFDRDTYNKRYLLEFSIFNQIENTQDAINFDKFKFKLTLANTH